MSKINKVVVKGVYYDIEDAYARKKVDSELPVNTIKDDISDLNYLVDSGIYNLENKRIYDNSPIINEGIVSARLTVLVTESDGNKVITQVLNLNNNVGGEGNIYIRACQNGEWKAWGKLQTNIEVGQVVEEEKSRAEQVEQAIKEKAVDADSLNFKARADVVALNYKTIEEVGDEIAIPAATTEKAGVMSSEDKATVNNAVITVDGEKKLAIADSEGNVIIEFDGHIKTKYFDSRNIPSVDVNNDFFAISDESGNIILILQNGHIKTQHFDSANGVSAVIEEKNNKNILYL